MDGVAGYCSFAAVNKMPPAAWQSVDAIYWPLINATNRPESGQSRPAEMGRQLPVDLIHLNALAARLH